MYLFIRSSAPNFKYLNSLAFALHLLNGQNWSQSIPFNSIPFRLQPISAQVNGLHKSNNKLLVCQIAGNLPHKNGNKTTKTCK
ncbi:hypothetical protein DERF_009915 [Dermatophagoides farinae]|uniref:Uncharacterized protein n=1 Tax=Dermatophagoides farinae TaxID=6954 RepID=A0A922HXV4_DERFA|nr:hypothetical protein DERF_009915 [Dermatophagoides farinae]